MNKTSIAVALAAIFSVGMGTPLWAASPSADTESQHMEGESRTEMNRHKDSAMQQQSTKKSTTVAINPKDYDGKEVINSKGKMLGTVDKLVINNLDHTVYAIVGMGGILGMGKKNASIPIDQLQSKGNKLQLAAGITQDSLEKGMKYEQSEFRPFEPKMDMLPTELDK